MRIITNNNSRPEEVNMLTDKNWDTHILFPEHMKNFIDGLPDKLKFDFSRGKEICVNRGNGLKKYKLRKYFPF